VPGDSVCRLYSSGIALPTDRITGHLPRGGPSAESELEREEDD
jgi:hypothetical protein